MKIAINAISAKRGGAVTYLQNVLPRLKQQRGIKQLIVWRAEAETGDYSWPDGIEYREDPSSVGRTNAGANPLSRLKFDQIQLPKMLKAEQVDVLFSSANFGVLRCPCRQVLLVRNTILFDDAYLQRVPAKIRAYYTFQRQLALLSIKAADVVLFPTQAIRDLVARYVKGDPVNWVVSHYGTQHGLFYPLAAPSKEPSSALRLLHVSLYCDQKNLGTLLQAVRLLNQRWPQRFSLRLTAGFEQDWMEESALFPNFRRERAIYRELQSAGIAEDTNWKKYGTLPDLYRSADIFVFPSYTESFGHPLVEAMASGLPIVAADVPVNRELCGSAALYFPTFDPLACAEMILRVSEDPGLRAKLGAMGREKVKAFTWEKHVSQLYRAFCDELHDPLAQYPLVQV